MEALPSWIISTPAESPRTYADDPATSFYRFGCLDNVYLCGAGTYPCGSVAGIPGYMCGQQLLRYAQLL